MGSVRSAAVAFGVGNVLAAVAVVAGGLASRGWLIVAGVVVGWAAGVVANRTEAWTEISTRTGLDRIATGARMVLVTAALSAVAAASPALTYAACAVVILACWSVAAAVLIASTTRHPMCAVRNLEGPRPAALLERPVAAARAVATVFPAADVVVVVAVVAAVAAGTSAATLTVAAVAAVVAVALGTAAALWPNVQSLRQASVGNAAVVAAVERLSPQAVVHVSAGAGQARYILGQWLPALESLRLRTLVVVREPGQIAALPETSLPVVLAPSGRELSRVVVPSVRVAFYLANGTLNGDLLREPLVRSVFLNHGDSDKSTSANPFNRVYDELWVAGQAAVDRYAAAGVDLAPDRFRIIGRPQLEGLAVGPRPQAEHLTMLYAPTFEGYFEESNYSSLERMGVTIVESLLRQRPDVAIVFKPHPATGHQRTAMTEARHRIERLLRAANSAGGRHTVVADQPGMTLYDAFAQSDVLLTDVSSVATDFLWTQRPLIATNPRGLDHATFAQTFPSLASAYLLDPDGSDVVRLVDLATGDDPLREHRLETKRYVLGDAAGGPIAAFVDTADDAYARAVAHAEKVRNTFTFGESASDTEQ